MNRSADLCLYVLVLHDGLLKESELDARVKTAQDMGTSLKEVLWADQRLDRFRLARLLEQRKRYERWCPACKKGTFVLPGQDSKCETCGKPVSEAPPVQAAATGRMPKPASSGAQPASAAAAAPAPAAPPPRATGSLGRPASAPGQSAIPAAAAAPDAPAPAPEDAPTVPVVPAPVTPAGPNPDVARALRRMDAPPLVAAPRAPAPAGPPPTPLQEIKGWFANYFRNMESRSVLHLVLLFGVLPLVLVVAWQLKVHVVDAIPWHISETVSRDEAAVRQTLRIALIDDPTTGPCSRFRMNVLEHGDVRAVIKEYVWQHDLASRGVEGTFDRSDHYVGVPKRSNDLPHLFIYNHHGQVVTGLIGCGDMTAQEFLAMLEDAKRDPRPIKERLADAGEE